MEHSLQTLWFPVQLNIFLAFTIGSLKLYFLGKNRSVTQRGFLCTLILTREQSNSPARSFHSWAPPPLLLDGWSQKLLLSKHWCKWNPKALPWLTGPFVILCQYLRLQQVSILVVIFFRCYSTWPRFHQELSWGWATGGYQTNLHLFLMPVQTSWSQGFLSIAHPYSWFWKFSSL